MTANKNLADELCSCVTPHLSAPLFLPQSTHSYLSGLEKLRRDFESNKEEVQQDLKILMGNNCSAQERIVSDAS